MESIGMYLAAKRAEKGEMQKEQAARLGIDASSLIHYSNGRKMGAKILQRIIDVYGHTAEEKRRIYATQVTPEERERVRSIAEAATAGGYAIEPEDVVLAVKYGI